MLVRISCMRKLDKTYRMQADSLQEIRRGLDRMAFDFGDERVGNRPASEGHIINAALLILMRMPEEQRIEAMKAAFETMNALMALDAPLAWQVEAIIAGREPVDPGTAPIRMTPGEKTQSAPKAKGKGKGAG